MMKILTKTNTHTAGSEVIEDQSGEPVSGSRQWTQKLITIANILRHAIRHFLPGQGAEQQLV